MRSNKLTNILWTLLLSLAVGAVIMLALGHNPVEAYIALFRGALVGKLSIGTTLQKFTPLLLTAMAFAVASKVNVFNVGVEGELYLGAMASAWLGYNLGGLPKPLVLIFCFAFSIIVGMLWASIPALLKANWGVNEICVTILLNYVAQYFTSYIVNGPFSAGLGAPQTPSLERSLWLKKIMLPSQLTSAVFIAVAVTVLLIWLMRSSKWGYQMNVVGQNAKHAEYIGISTRKTIVMGMLISGAIGGLAGALEIFGTFGYFLDNFSAGIAFDGMLIALIVKNDLLLVPGMAFFLAVLKSGALGMEHATGVPKAVVDMLIAIFIIFATMEIFASKLQLRLPNFGRKQPTNSQVNQQ